MCLFIVSGDYALYANVSDCACATTTLAVALMQCLLVCSEVTDLEQIFRLEAIIPLPGTFHSGMPSVGSVSKQ